MATLEHKWCIVQQNGPGGQVTVVIGPFETEEDAQSRIDLEGWAEDCVVRPIFTEEVYWS
jgi:hypothetical protein